MGAGNAAPVRQGTIVLINNRQGGRRRGRGGQRPQGMGGSSGGNRQDNRQRGNAAQLLEKYRNLARDAQLAGDRVQTEYYLQYADHYFRVLEENRSRYEDQQSHRRRRDEDESGDDEEVMAEADGDDEVQEQAERPRRGRDGRAPRQRSNGSPRHDDDREEAAERIALAALPPAIGSDDDGEDGDETPKPRRRARKPKTDEGDVAQA